MGEWAAFSDLRVRVKELFSPYERDGVAYAVLEICSETYDGTFSLKRWLASDASGETSKPMCGQDPCDILAYDFSQNNTLVPGQCASGEVPFPLLEPITSISYDSYEGLFLTWTPD